MNSRGASVLGACAAWILAAAPFFADASAFEGSSRAALAALPWIAYAGLPRRERGDGLAGLAFECALFAPPVALGAWYDAASGMETSDLLVVAGGSLACAALSALAARECARTSAARALYTVAWFTLVAGVPILLATLVLGGSGASGPGPDWLATVARASPLSWSFASLASGPNAQHLPFAPAALLAALIAFAFLAARRTEPEAEA